METMMTWFLMFLAADPFTLTSGQQNVCSRPVMAANIELKSPQTTFNPGMSLGLACTPGYNPLNGPRTIICNDQGEWTKTRFLCRPKPCPYPETLADGELIYEDIVFQSTINYSCHEGYTLIGSRTSQCLADGSWSPPEPKCKPVKCDLAPIPQFGMIIYDRRISGNAIRYGTRATYKCLPPYAVIGDPVATCTSSGDWTATPECGVVTCPPPENITGGYMTNNVQREFYYMETVKYGCHGDFVIEGNQQIVCQASGLWSEKPSCKAPCNVDLERPNNWVSFFFKTPKKVLHHDILSMFCVNKARNCSYAVPTQCIDGNIEIPECFNEEAGSFLLPGSGPRPSELETC